MPRYFFFDTPPLDDVLMLIMIARFADVIMLFTRDEMALMRAFFDAACRR